MGAFRRRRPGALKIVSALLVSCAMVFSVAAEKQGVWSQDYYVELAACSSLYSLGSVRADHAVWSVEGDVIQRLSSYGHILLGYWAMSDLTESADKSHRSTIYESDPYLFYGYDWDLADGWRWRNRAGVIWVFNEGYDVDVVHLFREWTYMGEISSPWCSLYGQTRAVEDLGTYVQIGMRREFGIVKGVLSMMPHIAFYGGSKRWNQRRYGNLIEDRAISAGLGTVDYGLRFAAPIKWGASFFVDICGYNALDERTRTQIRARRANGSTMKLDSCYVYSGLSWEF